MNIFKFLTLEEERKRQKFFKKHYKKCNSDPYFKVFPTGIGQAVHVVCPVCEKEKDITEYEKW